MEAASNSCPPMRIRSGSLFLDAAIAFGAVMAAAGPLITAFGGILLAITFIGPEVLLLIPLFVGLGAVAGALAGNFLGLRDTATNAISNIAAVVTAESAWALP